MDKKKAFNSPVPPLQMGKTFLCYRDVNKAIERHREMFGLRLALKRAIKLENYHLTVDQMKDLNLRLKYGELDYHCFAATGRPGRPGNDERCPQLVRLKLSPDAQSLVVYESHNHNILPSVEVVSKNFYPIKQKKDAISLNPDQTTCLKGDITLTPINPVQKTPVLILPKPAQAQPAKDQVSSPVSSAPCPSGNFIIDSKNSFTSLIPLSQQASSFSASSSSDTEVNSITITPTPPIPFYPQVREGSHSNEKSEKLTMKIKKSDHDPNEMVVVGSPQEREEQHKVRRNEDHQPAVKESGTSKGNPPENTAKEASKPSNQGLQSTKQSLSPAITNRPVTSATTTLKTGNQQKVISSNPKGGQKISQGGASRTPEGGKLVGASKPSSGTFQKGASDSNSFSSSKSPATQRPLNVPQKPNLFSKPTTVATKPTVLRQSPNMKQIIIKKSPQIGVGKQSTTKSVPPGVKPLGDKNPNVPNQVKKLAQKPVTNTKVTTNSKASSNSSNTSANTVQTTQESTNKGGEKIRLKNGERSSQQNGSDKQVNKSSEASAASKNSSSSASSGGGNNANSGGPINGNRLLSNPKKLKKKQGRPPDSSTSLDTELGIGEKQHLAHGVLFQLLKVTSQLPMVEFSYALDTLEILTDAFRLGQRVSLSIQRNPDVLYADDNYSDNYLGWRLKPETKEVSDSNTTKEEDTQPLLASQVDGQLDANDLLKGLASLNSVVSVGDSPRDVAMMDVDHPPKEANVSFPRRHDPPMRNESRPMDTHSLSSTSNKGRKRPSCTSYFGVQAKRSKF